MKFLKLCLALLLVLPAILACQPQSTDATEASAATASDAAAASTDGPALDTLMQKVSYSLGVNFGTQFSTQEIDVDLDTFIAGLKTGLAKEEPLLSQEQVMEAMQAFETQQRDKMQAKQEALIAKNSAAGVEFLAANKAKEGVNTTESGLQYKVLTEGKGAKPGADDTVKVHYRGTLLNGDEFDSSHKRGEPAEFGVGQVIAGWTEALQLMPAGSKWELYIPADLAYGPGGTRGIEPNSTLIFEVELLEVKKAEAKEAAAKDAAKK